MLELTIRPLGRVALKPPQPFTAGVHGPRAIGLSLSYPMPSTIAGMLAWLGWKNGGCGKTDDREFSDTRACVQNLLGENFRIYTGFLRSPMGIHVYVNSERLPQLRSLINELKRNLRVELEDIDHVLAEKRGFIGIALQRETKTVIESLIYGLEFFEYKPRSDILALIGDTTKTLNIDELIKMGAKTGLARIRLNSYSTEMKEFKGKYHALLIAPALLSESSSNKIFSGIVDLSDEKMLKSIGTELLKVGADSLKIPNFDGEGELVFVPKGEHEMGVQTMGWNMARRIPRKPMFVVPPGSLLALDLRKPIPLPTIEEFGILNLGDHSDLGWGTAVLFPIS